MVIFEAWLNNAMETPAAASSTAPKQINMTKLAPKAIKNQFKTGRGYCKRCFQN
jgi:hypothetical protein